MIRSFPFFKILYRSFSKKLKVGVSLEWLGLNSKSELVQGKLMEIHFSANGKICGAKLETCE